MCLSAFNGLVANTVVLNSAVVCISWNCFWTWLIESDFKSWNTLNFVIFQTFSITHMSNLCRSGVDRKVLAFRRTHSFLGTCFSKTLKSSRISSWALFSGQLDETSRVISIAASDMLDMCCFELWLWLLGRESESAKVWSVKLAEGNQDAACQQTSWIRLGLGILYGL